MEAATVPTSTALAPADYTDDLVLVQGPGQRGSQLALSPAARARFSQASVYLIAQKYAKAIRTGADVQAFMGLLEVATELDLNPLTNEVWLVKFNGVWVPMVGRDGYDTIAHRNPDVIGVTGGVHRKNDEFSAEFDSDTGWKIRHKMVGGSAQRGPIEGAWALLKKREGHDFYFYADRATYDKAGGQHKSAWDTHPDAMILKVPQSYVCRIGSGGAAKSSALPADEIALDLKPGDVVDGEVITGSTSTNGNSAAALPLDDGPDLSNELKAKLNRAYALDKLQWNRNKVLGRIPRGDGEADAIAAIDAEVTAWLAENEPQDADVVHEGTVVDEQPAAPPAQPEPAPEPALASDDEVQARYESDAAWREKVDTYRGSRTDLVAALEDASGEESEALAAQLATVEDQLRKLGVPLDWEPQAPGQTVLPL